MTWGWIAELLAMGASGYTADCLFKTWLEPVPEPSFQPTLSRAFVEHFVEPCGFWPFSTKWADKVHDKSPRTPFVGQALASVFSRNANLRDPFPVAAKHRRRFSVSKKAVFCEPGCGE